MSRCRVCDYSSLGLSNQPKDGRVVIDDTCSKCHAAHSMYPQKWDALNWRDYFNEGDTKIERAETNFPEINNLKELYDLILEDEEQIDSNDVYSKLERDFEYFDDQEDYDEDEGENT